LSQGAYAAVRIWLFCCSSGGSRRVRPQRQAAGIAAEPLGVSAALDFHPLPTVSRVGGMVGM